MNIILFRENAIMLCMATTIFTCINTFIQNKILINLLNLNSISFKKIWFIQAILFSVCRIIMPIQIHKILEVLLQIIIYKKHFNIRAEKIFFAEEINVIIFVVTELLIIRIFKYLYQITSFNNALINVQFLLCIVISTILIKILVLTILKKLKFTINIPECIRVETKRQIIEISIVSTVLIILDEIIVLNCINTIPNAIYILDVALILSYSFISIFNILKTIEIELDKNEINDLEGSKDRLQHKYDNICAFKHDFGNIMQGFGGFIKTRDINGLERMYDDVICECQEINNYNQFDKEIINNPAVYNIINNKYILAKQYDIKLKVEVYIDLNTLKIKTYELCRILGILLDNAIEAAKECDEKRISIKFIKDNYNNRDLIIIENTCKNYLVDINKMKQKGFTTKKNKVFHGLGLWKVNQIIKKNENLRLYTTRDRMFKQQLEIYTWK